MKNVYLKLTVLAATLMSATPAFAASYASASLNNLTVTLYSLNSGTPSITWDNSANYSYVDAYVNSYSHGNSTLSSTLNAPVSVSFGGASLGANAAVTNASGTPLNSSLTSNGQALGNGSYSADSKIYGNSFTLSANTMAVFSATATANANITIGKNGNGYEYADSFANLNAYGSYTSLGLAVSFSNSAALSADVSGGAQSGNNANMLSVSFTNLSNSSITGAIRAWTYANGYNGVSAVPEPGEWTLMASGLGLLGFIAIRRSKSA